MDEHSEVVISLRHVVKGDRHPIWQWANDPETRNASFASRIITWQEHVHWFEEKQNDPQCIFLAIIEMTEGSLIGSVRYDLKVDQACISINLAPTQRRKGFGQRAIRLSSDRIFSTTNIQAIIAEIKPSNTISLRVFAKAGFRPVGETLVHSIVASKFILERNTMAEK